MRRAPDFDTAVFTGNFADYSILPFDDNGDGYRRQVRRTDNVGTDGVDTLKHIERLQFADQSVVLSDLLTRRLPRTTPPRCAHDQRHDAGRAPTC